MTDIPDNEDEGEVQEVTPEGTPAIIHRLDIDWKAGTVVVALLIGLAVIIGTILTIGLGLFVNEYYKQEIASLDVTRSACDRSKNQLDSTLLTCTNLLHDATETLLAPTSTPAVVTATPSVPSPTPEFTDTPFPTATQMPLEAAIQNILESAFDDAADSLTAGRGSSLLYPPGGWGQPAYKTMTDFWDSIALSIEIRESTWRFDPVHDPSPIPDFRSGGTTYSLWARASLWLSGLATCGVDRAPAEFNQWLEFDPFNVTVTEAPDGKWYISTWSVRYDLTTLLSSVQAACGN